MKKKINFNLICYKSNNQSETAEKEMSHIYIDKVSLISEAQFFRDLYMNSILGMSWNVTIYLYICEPERDDVKTYSRSHKKEDTRTLIYAKGYSTLMVLNL